MHRFSTIPWVTLGALALALPLLGSACSSSSPSGFGTPGGNSSGGGSGGGSGSGSGGGSGSGSGGTAPPIGGFADGGPGGTTTTGDGGLACPAGLQCDVTCSGSGTTTISGKVYDPAGKNPLYNVAVYVPAVPLTALPKGVPTGSDACSCAALFKSGAITNVTTDVDGSFTLKNAPVGSSVPLVIQIGKWRHLTHVDVKSCVDNPQPDKSLKLPGTVAAGNTDDNIPDIAVSTGGADTLECLMSRIGLPATEYVAGPAGSGHIHVFAGGDTSGGKGGGGGGGGTGKPETPGMPGAPPSPTDLWSTQAQLMPYDIVLLSCEGGETYNANPAALESYLNAGGRAFGSHFHYSWFSGPLGSMQSYAAPADWGSNLATWAPGSGGGNNGALGGVIDTTLNGSSQPFSKGVALQKWLGEVPVSALGQGGVPASELSIYQPRFNAQVAATNKASQPWITSDSTSSTPNQTMYFSFDTPVNAPAGPNGAAPNYCGRAVFSDLHVAGDPMTNDTGSPPTGCSQGDLSPQEKALEFMLFDLSSCVIPDTVAPPTTIPPPPPK
ncbi:MAG TPA: hypothetical protein VGI39_37385 [Polyangiaceae bacterium]|jgi:hypothetical protein